ncbi:hypothetical protein IWZ00DRAFT_262854 [Phyllosticta capitalensis]
MSRWMLWIVWRRIGHERRFCNFSLLHSLPQEGGSHVIKLHYQAGGQRNFSGMFGLLSFSLALLFHPYFPLSLWNSARLLDSPHQVFHITLFPPHTLYTIVNCLVSVEAENAAPSSSHGPVVVIILVATVVIILSFSSWQEAEERSLICGMVVLLANLSRAWLVLPFCDLVRFPLTKFSSSFSSLL